MRSYISPGLVDSSFHIISFVTLSFQVLIFLDHIDYFSVAEHSLRPLVTVSVGDLVVNFVSLANHTVVHLVVHLVAHLVAHLVLYLVVQLVVHLVVHFIVQLVVHLAHRAA